MSRPIPFRPGPPVEPETSAEVLRRMHLPLENLAYTLEDYLRSRQGDLDPDTAALLAQVRDSVGQLARLSSVLARAA